MVQHMSTVQRVELMNQPRCPGVLFAREMLMRHPVQTTALPRLHVSPRRPDGARLVYDRATGEQYEVYAPRVMEQFRAGHLAGLWYLRPAEEHATGPRSQSFATARAAVDAIREGRWARSERPRKPARALPRVIW
jgi:hypothetical protein